MDLYHHMRVRSGLLRVADSVTQYSTKSGMLCLQHSQLSALHEPFSVMVVVVDVNLLVGSLKTTDTQIGEWVNVVGYVDGRVKEGTRVEVMVKALMLWSAGAINVSEYEAAVEGRKEHEQQCRRLKPLS